MTRVHPRPLTENLTAPEMEYDIVHNDDVIVDREPVRGQRLLQRALLSVSTRIVIDGK